MRYSPEDTQVSGEGEGGGVPGTRAEIPCSPWRAILGQRSTCSPQRSPHQSRWMQREEAANPWEDHAGGNSLRTCGEKSHPEVGLLVGLVALWGPVGRTPVVEFQEDCVPRKRLQSAPHSGAGEEQEQPSLLGGMRS